MHTDTIKKPQAKNVKKAKKYKAPKTKLSPGQAKYLRDLLKSAKDD